METVEVVVYLSISFIVGILILNFIGAIDTPKLFKNIKDSISDNKEMTTKEVTKEEFVSTIINFWEQNAMCIRNATLAMYVMNETPVDEFNKTYLFKKVKSIHMCSVLQSKKFDCGIREHVNLTTPITLPKIIRLSCNTTSEQMVIR